MQRNKIKILKWEVFNYLRLPLFPNGSVLNIHMPLLNKSINIKSNKPWMQNNF